MKLKHFISFKAAVIAAALSFSVNSCVTVNQDLGHNLLPKNQLYDVYLDTLYLEDITTRYADSLSAYSTNRFTIGAIRSDVYGLTTKGSALTLVPLLDSIDLGKNTKIREFYFSALKDTTSVIDPSHEKIIQNIKVYELEVPGTEKGQIWETLKYTSDLKNSDFYGKKVITEGSAIYRGDDSLSFKFSKEFTEKFVDGLKKMTNANGVCKPDSIKQYLGHLPGIYITTDEPIGQGGRINMFDIKVQTTDSYISANFAELKITADYGEKTAVDTSFLFLLGPEGFVTSQTLPTQYAFNTSNHESKVPSGQVIEKAKIEGGSGPKPVISGKEIYTKMTDLFAQKGIIDPSAVIVNKATIVLPYVQPTDYDGYTHYPMLLNPTCRIKTDDSEPRYASITDAGVSDENHGDINRSLFSYRPDISFHAQEILRLKSDAKFSNYDLWMFIMRDEPIKESSITSDAAASNEYYNQLAMAQYYNSMYNPYGGYGGYGYGGYGGYYGGYGGYYDSYGYGGSNYYNYYMMSQMYSSYNTSSQNEEMQTVLDPDRYYDGEIYGPGAAKKEHRPHMIIIYSVPKDIQK